MRRAVLIAALAFLSSDRAAALAQEPPVPPDFPQAVALRDPDPVPEPTPSPAPPEKKRVKAGDFKLSVVGGAAASLATKAKESVVPFARISVDGIPFGSAFLTPRLYTRLELGASPGDTISIGDPRTFRSIAYYMAGCQRISEGVYFDVCLGAGFASRLQSEEEPRESAVKHGDVHLRFGRAGKGWLEFGVGRDQRLDGLYRWAFVTSGAVTILEPQIGGAKGSVQIIGSAVIGMDLGNTLGQARRDVYLVGVAGGR